MKIQIRLLSMIRTLSLCLFISALPQTIWADAVSATITSVKGDVSVTDASGAHIQPVVGAKLSAGDTVKTGATGTLGLTLTPGSGTVVQPNTYVKISTLDFTKGPDGSNNRKVALNLKNGELISTLFKKDGHSDFQVATPYGVAAAKGTSWAVIVEGNGLTVQVANGVVTVTNAAGAIVATIPAGEGYDSTTGAVTTLPQSVIDAIVGAIQAALPDLALTAAQIQQALNSATINPATVNSSTNSPTQ